METGSGDGDEASLLRRRGGFLVMVSTVMGDLSDGTDVRNVLGNVRNVLGTRAGRAGGERVPRGMRGRRTTCRVRHGDERKGADRSHAAQPAVRHTRYHGSMPARRHKEITCPTYP
ncbi:hypothetical protein GCM10010156_20990 [Planobispora rosea]|uniref:Uncharacterized protein n=1 Tax=Planobispora rosea TaxID=35762 RepID=A0A8J3S6I8_PLARO|nr:hypothetical protein GCM10010156_20990 [Planobispora rosea]GIH84388.1 hypothetical protein Pro02_27960 [Planobispora rosea]